MFVRVYSATPPTSSRAVSPALFFGPVWAEALDAVTKQSNPAVIIVKQSFFIAYHSERGVGRTMQGDGQSRCLSCRGRNFRISVCWSRRMCQAKASAGEELRQDGSSVEVFLDQRTS